MTRGAYIKKLSRFTRSLAMADIHSPFNIPLDPVEELMADFRPQVIVYAGDIIDVPYLSKFDEGDRTELEFNLASDYHDLREMIKRHKKISGATRIYYLEGNHERRIRKWLKKNPEVKGLIELPKGVGFKDLGVEWYEENRLLQIGNLWYMHGAYCSTYHARKTLLAYQRNIRYGHAHDTQSITEPRPYDISFSPRAESIACLCNKNPDFLVNKPNRWVHGFNVAEIDESSEYFWDYTVRILDGKCKLPMNDKIYGLSKYKQETMVIT